MQTTTYHIQDGRTDEAGMTPTYCGGRVHIRETVSHFRSTNPRNLCAQCADTELAANWANGSWGKRTA
jgi:hypothetical protein